MCSERTGQSFCHCIPLDVEHVGSLNNPYTVICGFAWADVSLHGSEGYVQGCMTVNATTGWQTRNNGGMAGGQCLTMAALGTQCGELRLVMFS